MDGEFAQMVLAAAFRSSREIGELARMAKAFSEAEQGPRLKGQMVDVLAELGKLTEAVYEIHPDLRALVDARIEKYGKAF